MKSFYIHPAANEDIIEQFTYLIEKNLNAADKFIDSVNQTVLRILELPKIGRLVTFENSQLEEARVWPVSNFEVIKIYYRETEEEIEIIRVLHGKRDVQRILEN